jgi:hypothetical protein
MRDQDPAAGRDELIAFRTSTCLLMITARELAVRRSVTAAGISVWLQAQVGDGRLIDLGDGTYALPGAANA